MKMMPQDQKDVLVAQVKASQDSALGLALDQAFDAGVASVPVGPGFSQADLDAAHQAGVDEGKLAEKGEIKSVVDAAIDAAP
jgi:hypothetical protein